MSILTNILTDGAILSLLASLWLILALWVNPRIFLHDYLAEIQEKVPNTALSIRSLGGQSLAGLYP